MGLPINFAFAPEPQADEAFQWGGSKTPPSDANEGFATIPLGVDGLADERDDHPASSVKEPQPDEGMASSPLGTLTGGEIADSFVFLPSSTAESGNSVQTDPTDGPQMEGVEIGIAAPSDQDLFIGSASIAAATADAALPTEVYTPIDPGFDEMSF